MDLKLPPPVLLLIMLGAMYLLSQYWPLWTFSFTGQLPLVGGFSLAGILVGLAGNVSFARNGTTIDPRHPDKASKLVTTGIYRFSRNPMYLGLVMLLIAAFLYLSALSSLAVIPLFIIYIHHFQIGPEEAVLEAMFGDEYRRYCKQVRRWC